MEHCPYEWRQHPSGSVGKRADGSAGAVEHALTTDTGQGREKPGKGDLPTMLEGLDDWQMYATHMGQLPLELFSSPHPPEPGTYCGPVSALQVNISSRSSL